MIIKTILQFNITISAKYIFFYFAFLFLFFSLDIQYSHDSRRERPVLISFYHSTHFTNAQATAAKSSPQNIASDQTETENLWFLSASCYPLSCTPLTGNVIKNPNTFLFPTHKCLASGLF